VSYVPSLPFPPTTSPPLGKQVSETQLLTYVKLVQNAPITNACTQAMMKELFLLKNRKPVTSAQKRNTSLLHTNYNTKNVPPVTCSN
jgi:hypothetical protein